MSFIKNLFKGDQLGPFQEIVEQINALEEEVKKFSAAELKSETEKLKDKFKSGVSMEEITPMAFALAREAAWRTLGQRPFDVQLLGGLALNKGAVVEMATGEGKTLSAVAPAFLNA